MIPKFVLKAKLGHNPDGPKVTLLDFFHLGVCIQVLILLGLCFNSSFGFEKVCSDELSFFGAHGANTLNIQGGIINQILLVLAVIWAHRTSKLQPLTFMLGLNVCLCVFGTIGLAVDYYRGVDIQHGVAEKNLFVNILSLAGNSFLGGVVSKLILLGERIEKILSPPEPPV